MSFEVTVTPTVYDVEVAVNQSVQPFDVEVTVGNVPDLDLTTNGDSGASTFDPLTGELNIPEYTLDGLGGVPESRTLTINGTTQDLSANRTFTIPTHDAVTIGSPANGLAIDGNQVLTIGLASSGANGALSSTDWSTFNNKQNALGFTPEDVANKSTDTGLGTSNSLYPSQGAVKSYVDTGLSGKENALGFTPENVANKAINFTSPDDTKYPTTLAVSTALAGKQDILTNPITGTGVAGQVSFGTGSGTIGGDNGLTWDNVNKRLGLGGTSIRPIYLSRTIGNSIIRLNRSDENISSAIGGIEFSNFINQVIAGIGIFTEGGNDLGSIRFFTSSNNNQTSLYSLSERWRINNIGNLIAIGGNSITSTSNGNINLTPNGTGLVGIATTSPTNTLDVNGTGRIRNGVSLADTSGNVVIGSLTDAGFRLDVNGTARIQGALTTNLTAGRVPFIGTGGVLSDDYKLLYSSTTNSLEIQGLIGALPSLRINNLSAGDTAYMFIDFVGIRTTTNVAVRIRANRRGTLDFMTQDLPSSVNPVLRWSINNTGIFQSEGAQTIRTSTGDLTLATNGGNGDIVLTPNGTGTVSITDAKNISLGTTTGTKIGTATSQKLAFWNATPIVQPTTSVADATIVGGGGTTLTDTDTFDGYTLAQIVKALRNMGALA